MTLPSTVVSSWTYVADQDTVTPCLFHCLSAQCVSVCEKVRRLQAFLSFFTKRIHLDLLVLNERSASREYFKLMFIFGILIVWIVTERFLGLSVCFQEQSRALHCMSVYSSVSSLIASALMGAILGSSFDLSWTIACLWTISCQSNTR